MTVRANSNFKFLLKFLLIALGLIGWGLYSLYDAMVTGPNYHMQKAMAYWAPAEEGSDEPWVKRHTPEEWTKIAEENHWKIGEPKTPSKAKGFIYYNYVMALGCIPIGALALFKFLKSNKTWIEANDSTFETSRGVKFDLDQIKSIDKKKWAKKGLAKILYTKDGKDKTYVLDDLKYLRDPTDEILYNIEQTLDDDQILNGEREKSPAEVAEAKRLAAEAKKKLENVDD